MSVNWKKLGINKNLLNRQNGICEGGNKVKKKIMIIFLILTCWFTSVAFAFVMGGSNLGMFGYPKFDGYLSYKPSRYEVETYIQKAKEYTENCNYDINRIQEAKQAAITEANAKISQYNKGY